MSKIIHGGRRGHFRWEVQRRPREVNFEVKLNVMRIRERVYQTEGEPMLVRVCHVTETQKEGPCG